MRTVEITDEEYEMICELFVWLMPDRATRSQGEIMGCGIVSSDNHFVYEVGFAMRRYVTVKPDILLLPITHGHYKYIKAIVDIFFRNFRKEIAAIALRGQKNSLDSAIAEVAQAKKGLSKLGKHLGMEDDDGQA